MKNTQNILQTAKNDSSLDWDLEAILEGKPFDFLHSSYAQARKEVISAYDRGNCYLSLEGFRKYAKACDKYAILANRI